MHRREPNRAAPPLFAAAGGWHAWRYWPGLFGLLSVFLLWFVVIAEVMVPLGHTLAQLRELHNELAPRSLSEHPRAISAIWPPGWSRGGVRA